MGAAPEHLTQARAFFDRALAADPDNAVALGASGAVDAAEVALGYVRDPVSALSAAEAKLSKALSLVPDHPPAHVAMGIVCLFSRRVPQGIALCEYALRLDRNLAIAHGWIGLGKYFIGRFEDTEVHVLELLRLSSREPSAHAFMAAAGAAKSALGLHDEAAAWYRRSIEANRTWPLTHFSLAGALAELGRLEELRIAVRTGLALDPTFSLAGYIAAYSSVSDDPKYLAWFAREVDAMRKAGLPE